VFQARGTGMSDLGGMCAMPWNDDRNSCCRDSIPYGMTFFLVKYVGADEARGIIDAKNNFLN
jgi:hypothetical protein